MAQVRSVWADHAIIIGGALSSSEWDGAGVMPIPAGYMMVKNDATYLYVALDVVADRGRDPGTGDYFWFVVDVDGNRQITPHTDLLYAAWPGHPNRLGHSYYIRPGRVTTLREESSTSRVHIGFGHSVHSQPSHRVWELRLSLEELGADLSASDALPVVRFGVRLSSTNPRFTFDYPAGIAYDFSRLHEIVLARQPENNYPSGTAGIVIGGVGLIPASEITDGYATTDSSYYLYVDEAAFGRRMNLIGNRVTMKELWDRGATQYRMLHRFDGSGSFSPIRQNWTNYHWVDSTYVLEQFGPDDHDRYRLLSPAEDYSIDDLLLQWQSVGYLPGIHEFRAEFFDADGNVVTAPHQILALMIDNNSPEVDVVNILHDGSPVPPCALEHMADDRDGVQFRITAYDPEGQLRSYVLEAHYGDGARDTITSDSYASHRDPAHRWEGVRNVLVPPGEWVPPETCAYQFRLRAYPRVTNGYHYVGGVEDTRHVTLIKPATRGVAISRISHQLPYGFVTKGKLADEGEEPTKLGKETLEMPEEK